MRFANNLAGEREYINKQGDETTMATTETDVRKQIQYAMSECESVMYTTGFEDAGVMTNDTGFVVKMDDGSEFQVTIRQSK